MTKFKITQEIIDYINKYSVNFSEIQPSPTLGEWWIIEDVKNYPNVNNGNPVVEAKREDGCFIRLPEDIVRVYTVDNENNSFFSMKIVFIKWIDSVRTFDWTLLEEIDTGFMDCESVGFLIKETEDFVTIAQNYGLKPKQVCNLITIPKCSIISIKEYDCNNNE